jgi:hypothetical protein
VKVAMVKMAVVKVAVVTVGMKEGCTIGIMVVEK